MGSENIKREEIKPPELQNVVPECRECDAAIAMGLVTAFCQINKEGEECVRLVEPVSKGEADPVKVLAETFTKYGEDKMNEMIDRANWLIYRAAHEAAKMLEKEQQQKEQKEQQSSPQGSEASSQK